MAIARAGFRSPLSGAGLLVIFLQVLPDVARRGLPHPTDQALVEDFGRIDPGVAEQVVERNDFGDDGDVLSGIQRNGDQGDVDAQNRRCFSIESRSIDDGVLVPLLEAHDELDALLLADGPDTEDRRNVDEADAPDLHVVTLELMCLADQHVISAAGSDHQVVGHESVPALDEVEHTFGFSDSAFSGEEESDAENVGERAVQGGRLRELALENRLDAAVELRCLEVRAQKGNSPAGRCLPHSSGRLLPLGDDHGGHRKAEESDDYPLAIGRWERCEIRHFCLAQYLQPFRDETVDVSGESEAGTGDVRVWNYAVEAHSPANVAKRE